MIRLVTTVAFALGVLALIASILAFVAGWWILGIVMALVSVFGFAFSLAGMSIIVLSEAEL